MMLTPGADVVPLDDLRTHVVPGGYDDDDDTTEWLALERPTTHAYGGCWCMPRVEPVAGLEGLGAIYIHRAMDRREEGE